MLVLFFFFAADDADDYASYFFGVVVCESRVLYAAECVTFLSDFFFTHVKCDDMKASICKVIFFEVHFMALFF